MPPNPAVQDAIAARLRREPAISQRALAVEAGVTPTQLGEYLSGKRRPLPQQLVRLAAPLGVTVEQLEAQQPRVDELPDDVASLLRDLATVADVVEIAAGDRECPDLLAILRAAQKCAAKFEL